MTNRVLDLHNWSTNRLRSSIVAFVKEATSPQMRGVAHNLLDAGRFEAFNTLLTRAVERLGNNLPNLFSDLVQEEMKHLGYKLGSKVSVTSLAKARAPTFNPTNERAISLMQDARLNFIQGFSDEQKAITRQILANAFAQGQGVRQTASQLMDSIGLTRTQLAMVDNYRRALERGSVDALTRQLRDRRFDSTVQRAIDGDVGLTSDQIDRMVDRYRQQMVNYRAENIARTESLSILSAARQEAMDQVIEQTGIDRSNVTRIWHATKDNRTRDSHAEMDNQEVAMDQPFESGLGNELMYPGDPSAPAADRVNCRCSISYNVGG